MNRGPLQIFMENERRINVRVEQALYEAISIKATKQRRTFQDILYAFLSEWAVPESEQKGEQPIAESTHGAAEKSLILIPVLKSEQGGRKPAISGNISCAESEAVWVELLLEIIRGTLVIVRDALQRNLQAFAAMNRLMEALPKNAQAGVVKAIADMSRLPAEEGLQRLAAIARRSRKRIEAYGPAGAGTRDEGKRE